MNSPTNLVQRKQELEEELNRLLDRRGAAKTEDDRCKLMPEAARIMSALREVEEAMKNGEDASGQ
jgi:hypothetical protein